MLLWLMNLDLAGGSPEAPPPVISTVQETMGGSATLSMPANWAIIADKERKRKQEEDIILAVINSFLKCL